MFSPNLETLEAPTGSVFIVSWQDEFTVRLMVRLLGDTRLTYSLKTLARGWGLDPTTPEMESHWGRIHVKCLQSTQNGNQTWYGFKTERDKNLFLQLIEVDKVGGSSALKMLGRAGFDAIHTLIDSGDKAAFLKTPGFGGKLGQAVAEVLFKDKPQPTVQAAPALDMAAVEALKVMGYQANVAKGWVQQAQAALGSGADTSAITFKALALAKK